MNLQAEIAALAPWFHNLHLPDGSQTAPGHHLGDFPRFKWCGVMHAVPADLRGWRVLDVGCNAGFYSFELARRGAQVLGLDPDPHYLRQARWAAERMRMTDRVRFLRGHVHELLRHDRYDLVWFTGVFYHLRYPLLALDLVRRVTTRLLMFQSLTMPGAESFAAPADVDFDDRRPLLSRDWPKMAFIEHALAHDPTNWWVPNATAVEALLRSAGFRVCARPEHEFYLCEPVEAPHTAELDLLRASLGQAQNSVGLATIR